MAEASRSGSGILYVVATPIGNLEDIGARATRILGSVAAVAAEDTRHTRRLLSHLGLRKPLISLHEHNEDERLAPLIARLAAGENLALVSDAGTPLISDPGYRLVRGVSAAGVAVRAVPGPSAVIAALSVAGLPTDRFAFEGFPPARRAARRRWLAALAREPRTLVLFESPRRLAVTLSDLAETFGGAREAVVARELTKLHETVRAGALAELAPWLAGEPEQQRGEAVVVVAGCPERAGPPVPGDADQVLATLLAELPTRQAVRLAAKITGMSRNRLYQRAIQGPDAGQ